MALTRHQYIDRASRDVVDERLFGDRVVSFLYSGVRENAPLVFKALTSARISSLLGWLNFDSVLGSRFGRMDGFIRSWGVDLSECLDEPQQLDTPSKIFTRKIRYWRCRPMSRENAVVTSPADSRMLLGSLDTNSLLFIKEKFFSFQELLGEWNTLWLTAFQHGDFAVFRLTPEKYHYVHTPAVGQVLDFYTLQGVYHSCNPGAVVSLVSPYSKNMRVVTILDTDVNGGSGVGLVAVIEVVALMVGDIVQCYSEEAYENPRPVSTGSFLRKGCPKSLFKPGSSTVVVLFQPGRVSFDRDLMDNQRSVAAVSRYSLGFGQPLAETEVQVRERIGVANQKI